jgi:hypothetical protein
MSASRIKTVVLYASAGGVTSYHDDWREAFVASTDLATTCLDVRDKRGLVGREVASSELVVVLHSATADILSLEPCRQALESRKGTLLAFVGNEVNYPQHGAGMRHKLAFLREVAPEFIATQLPIETARVLYADLDRSTVIAAPHALNPHRFQPLVANERRAIDIGVRSFAYYPFLGDNERNAIMNYFARARFDPRLHVDIETDESKRFTAEEWPRFLNTCKGTISTEAGSYYLEKDDATAIAVADYIKKTSGAARGYSLGLYQSRVKGLVPRSMKGWVLKLLRALRLERLSPYHVYHSVDFDDVHRLFFRDYENGLNGKCISSRHFDAIGTKTCQIMFPGRFNDILDADVHYIALERDFSNIDVVLEKFHDISFRCKMVDDAYDYVMSAHTYDHRLQNIVGIVMARA